MESLERARLDAFFRRVTEQFPVGGPITSLIITHLLSERPAFLRAMAETSTVGAVLPKPKSVDQRTQDVVQSLYQGHDL